MLSLSQNIIILVLVLAAALLFTVWLGRLWPAGERDASEDLIGWQLNILGITYWQPAAASHYARACGRFSST
jgi:hypothetical protein